MPKDKKNKELVLTDAEIKDQEKLMAESDPSFLLTGEFLSIKTKDGRLIRLRMNQAQTIMLDTIKEIRKSGKPVRIWVLKSRQEGISTVVEALIYARTSQNENVNSLIIADEKEHSNNLFDMSKLYHEMLEREEPHLAPKLKRSNEKKLEFDGMHSQIVIATAENTEAARSHTFQYVHLSEVAFFRDFDTLMTGLNQSVPDHKETMIIGETTANGRNFFYNEWVASIEGRTDWYPLFIPWFWMEEYSLPLQNDELYPFDNIDFGSADSAQTFLREENALQERFKLSDEQINWRRWAIVNKCTRSIRKFMQEYPAHWEEAFQMSGDMFFDPFNLNKQRVEKPRFVGEVFENNLKYEFRSLKEGRMKIYEKPEGYEQYAITVDASEALGRDEASVFVGNLRTNKTSAVVNGQYPPEDLAHMAVMLGNYYNKGIIAPENGGYGYMVCQLINKVYGNIYRMKNDQTGEPIDTNKIGFNTNSRSRPDMLALMSEEINHNSTDLLDRDLINQCRSFVINQKNNKAEASEGAQDGIVICYDNKTRVLTASGWKYIKDVEVGELIPSLNIKTKEVQLVKNNETVILPYKGRMINFKGKSIDLVVTPEHKMIAALGCGHNEYRDYEFIEAKDLLDKRFRLIKDGEWSGSSPEHYTIPAFDSKTNHKMNTPRDVDIIPFLKLLGFYIAEGSGNKNRISLSQMPYSKGWIPIKKALDDLGFEYNEYKDRFEIGNTQLASFIKDLIPGLCYEKRIPREILNLSPVLLKHLFDFMMLGDGYGERIYITTSPGLKDDFLELVNKLGLSATSKICDKIGEKAINGYTRRPIYVISINSKCLRPRLNHDEYFGKQVFESDYEGNIYCLNLEKNHTLLVEREGRTCWSGNCRAIFSKVMQEHPYKASITTNSKRAQAAYDIKKRSNAGFSYAKR